MSSLPILTPEDRAKMLEKAALTRKKKQDEALEIYKMDWADALYWKSLASEAGIRLPVYTKPPTSRGLMKYCELLGIDYHKHVHDNYGCSGFTAYAKRMNTLLSQTNNGKNTQYNLLAYVGWLLEDWKEAKMKKDSASLGLA